MEALIELRCLRFANAFDCRITLGLLVCAVAGRLAENEVQSTIASMQHQHLAQYRSHDIQQVF